MQRILDPFDASRAHPWDDVVEFLENAPKEGPLLDLAAGNGRHSLPAARLGHPVVALDVARGLMQRLRRRLRAQGLGGADCVEGDLLTLPLADHAVHKAVFAAGLHCVRGRANRIAALVELHRVMVGGGAVLLTVWWRDPKRFRGPLRRTEAMLRSAATEVAPTHVAFTSPGGGPVPPVEPGDVSLPWGHGVDAPVDRFFHLYTEEELIEELKMGSFKEIEVRRVRYGSTWNLIADARA